MKGNERRRPKSYADLIERMNFYDNYSDLSNWSEAKKIWFIHDVIIPVSDKQHKREERRTRSDLRKQLFNFWIEEKEGVEKLKIGEAWELFFVLYRSIALERRCYREMSETGRSLREIKAKYAAEFRQIKIDAAQEIADVCYRLVAYNQHLLPRLYDIAKHLGFVPEGTEVSNHVLDFCIIKYDTRIALNKKLPKLENDRLSYHLRRNLYGGKIAAVNGYISAINFLDDLLIVPATERYKARHLEPTKAPDQPQAAPEII